MDRWQIGQESNVMPLDAMAEPRLLATSYPLWFVVLAWLSVFLPMYPGLIVLAAGMFIRQSKIRSTLLIVGLGLTVAGLMVVVLNWDSIR